MALMTEGDVRNLCGNRALFSKYHCCGPDICELKILETTPKYVKVQYLTGAIDWTTISDFIEEYEFLENLPPEGNPNV